MESIVCEGSNSLKYLELLDFDLSRVPSKIVNSSLKKIVSKCIVISIITGFRFSMLDNLSCEELKLEILTIPMDFL